MRSLILALAMLLAVVSVAVADITGDWIGTLDANGVKLRVAFHVARDGAGKLSGTTVSLDQGGARIPIGNITFNGKKVYFEQDEIDAEYFGELTKDGKIEGRLQQNGYSAPLTFERNSEMPVLEVASSTATAQPFAGDWAGIIEAVKLRLALRLANTNGVWTGSMVSIDQGGGDIPFSAVTVDGNKLHLEIKAINGTYDGTLDEKSQTITGTWSQNGNMLPLNFARGEASAIPGPKRPQEPKPPFPYRSEDVIVPGPGGNTLAGTFTAPNGSGPFPAVFLITGSGAQDRNEEVMGHKPFLVLSDYLTRNGIAVLRVDDRGFGKSTGDANGTTEDFAQDAESAVAFLKARKDVDAKKIGLVGHSEGGFIAPIVASRSKDVAFVVMMAGPGVHADDMIARQLSDLARINGTPDAGAQQVAAAARRMCRIATSTDDRALMRTQADAVADSLTAQLTVMSPMQSQMISQQAHGIVDLILNPWFRYLLTLKPEETLRKVKQPVLAINGSLDLQVSAKENLPAIKKALEEGGNKDVTVMELPGLNHPFQTAKTGSPMEYSTIEETMSPVALKTISDWIVAHTTPKKK